MELELSGVRVTEGVLSIPQASLLLVVLDGKASQCRDILEVSGPLSVAASLQ